MRAPAAFLSAPNPSVYSQKCPFIHEKSSLYPPKLSVYSQNSVRYSQKSVRLFLRYRLMRADDHVQVARGQPCEQRACLPHSCPQKKWPFIHKNNRSFINKIPSVHSQKSVRLVLRYRLMRAGVHVHVARRQLRKQRARLPHSWPHKTPSVYFLAAQNFVRLFPGYTKLRPFITKYVRLFS